MARRIFACVLAVLALAGAAFLILGLRALFSGDTSEELDYPIVVSLGDSYSSGEGAEPFYGQGEGDFLTKVGNDDWIAHRSEASWPGKLVVTNGDTESDLASLKDAKWYFVASSGAETQHLTQAQEKTYDNGASGSDRVAGERYLAPQLEVFDALEPDTVDYVTVTLGGNDIGFGNIITQAALEIDWFGTGSLGQSLRKKLDTFDSTLDADALGMRLARAYQAISEKAGSQAQLIIVGYPTLFDETSSNALISASEAKTINDAVRELDEKMADLCAELGQDMNKYGITIKNLHYVSVLSEFSGHEGEYLNGIMLGAQSEDIDQTRKVSNYSVHPNAQGTSAYARVVQQTIDELEAARLKR